MDYERDYERAASEWDDLRDSLYIQRVSDSYKVNHHIRQTFTTQGGGKAEFDSQQGRYVFITKPDVPGLEIGDFVPEEWDLIPIKYGG